MENLTGEDWLVFNFVCSLAILAVAILFSVHHFQRRNPVAGIFLIIIGLVFSMVISFVGSACLGPSDLHRVTCKYYSSYSFDNNGNVYTIGKSRYSKDGSHDSQIAHIDTITHYGHSTKPKYRAEVCSFELRKRQKYEYLHSWNFSKQMAARMDAPHYVIEIFSDK